MVWLKSSVVRHPLGAYFVFAFAISWVAWIPWALGIQSGFGTVLFLVGGFGPLVAAALVIRTTGGSLRAWLAGIRNWRVAARFYAFDVWDKIATFYGWPVVGVRLA
jgi:hypothetical protein